MTLNGGISAGSGAGLPACLFTLFLLFSPVASGQITLPQSDGTTLTLDAPAERVITLAPNLTEMMYDAGAGHLLLATVEYSNFPEAATRLPRIGDAFRFDLEQIMALRPDLVIGWSSGNPAVALDRLESLGLDVWRIEIQEPADIATQVEKRLAALSEKYRGQRPVSYFYQVAERPLFTLNGEHIVSQGLSLCGGQNVFADEPVIAPQITREAVLVADPEVFIAPLLPDAEDPLHHWRSWPRLTAVRNDALHYLSADKISRATPRMLDSLELGCTLLHQYRSPKESQEQS
jgi:iron complex transport system substrate-binding protein